ncbi:MAG TPA: carboxypeptidase regulatory-like domain-containing protein [Pirellulales bacterium]|nr:carboxypeptidase regulatory-like domain-containing protein [Pirellulales bacterium]
MIPYHSAPAAIVNDRGCQAVGLLVVWATLLLGLAWGDAVDGEPEQPSTTAIAVSGRVSSDAMAAASAAVYLREAPASWSQSNGGMRPSPTRNITQTTADAEGRFEFKKMVLSEPRPGWPHLVPLDVIVSAAGRGIAWRHVPALPAERLELDLPAEGKVAGRATERDGRPAAGVRIRVREIAGLDQPWRPSLESPDYLDLESAELPLAAVTDADGQFVLRGLPANVRATLVVDDRRFLLHETYVATTDEPQRDLVAWPAGPRNGKPYVVRVHSWYCKIEVERAYRMLGHVVLADTGKPALGAGWNEPPIVSPPKDVTGADGRFTLEGLAPGKVRLRITPPSGSDYLGVESSIELSGDNYEVEHTVELPRGEPVRGRVVDAKNGNGIGGATIWHVQQQGPRRESRPFAEKVESAADGRFAIAVLPGEAELIVAGPVRGYVTHFRSGSVTAAPAEFHRAIDVRPGRNTEEVTFELQPKLNAALVVQVVDADGKPIEGAEIQYQGFAERDGFGARRPPERTTSDAQGHVVLEDLEPSLQYLVRAFERRRGLGGFVLLSQLDQPTKPLTIELAPLAVAVGRVIDEDGRALVNAVVRRYDRQGRYSYVDSEPVATDRDGRFELPRLCPKAAYGLNISCDDYAGRQEAEFTAVSGETHVLGDIVLPRADQEIAGVLVDDLDEPVVGARVFAGGLPADPRFRSRTDTRLTDSQGRFRLIGLPKGEVVVYQSFDQFDNRRSELGRATAGAKSLRFVTDAAAAGRQ